MRKKTSTAKKIKYTDGPRIEGYRVRDDLPPPGRIVRRGVDTEVRMRINSDELKLIEKQASRLRRDPEQLMASVIYAYAEGLR